MNTQDINRLRELIDRVRDISNDDREETVEALLILDKEEEAQNTPSWIAEEAPMGTAIIQSFAIDKVGPEKNILTGGI